MGDFIDLCYGVAKEWMLFWNITLGLEERKVEEPEEVTLCKKLIKEKQEKIWDLGIDEETKEERQQLRDDIRELRIKIESSEK